MRLLLDTNAYTAMRNDDARIREFLDRAIHIYMSAIVLGELFAGFESGSRKEENVEILEAFLSHPDVIPVPVTDDTARGYGLINASLSRKGRLIPSNDMWIAAHALETGAELLTFDKHFDDVEGIAVRRLPPTS